MSDPTIPVTGACFLVAAAAYVVCVAIRYAMRAGRATPPSLPAGKVATWFYKPLDMAGAGFVFIVFFGLFLLGAAAGGTDPEDLTASALVFNIGFQFMLAGVILAIGLARASADNWLGLYWKQWHWMLLVAPASVALMWGIFIALDAIGYQRWMESLGAETVQETVQLIQTSNDPAVLILMVITAVIVAPICEEIVFRGYLYPVMKRFGGLWPAALCSSLLFAAAHGNMAVVLPLLLLSLLLVLIYEKTGSLWAPIAVHLCFNAASVGIQLLARIYELPPELLGQ